MARGASEISARIRGTSGGLKIIDFNPEGRGGGAAGVDCDVR